jgi:pyrroline-5-carboxylate reductase
LQKQNNLAIIGAGNIGLAIARGLVKSSHYRKEQLILRRLLHLEELEQEGFKTESTNIDAVKAADLVIISVEPQQIREVLMEIAPYLETDRHILISVVSGVTIKEILRQIKKEIPVIRAMPNTAIAIQESMTCLAAADKNSPALQIAKTIFDSVGETLLIEEEKMIPATALGACGIAFFLRVIRAASQGGIEIGFHSDEALKIASQTAKGAASLLLDTGNHPERETDKVTTPRGCTIAGLNRMEHAGFSSALIQGIVTSCEKAAHLYESNNKNSE